MASGAPLPNQGPQLTLVPAGENAVRPTALPTNAGGAGAALADTSMWPQSVENRLTQSRADMQLEVDKLAKQNSNLFAMGLGAVTTLFGGLFFLYFHLSGDIKEARDKQQETAAQLSTQVERLTNLRSENARLSATIDRLEDRGGSGRRE